MAFGKLTKGRQDEAMKIMLFGLTWSGKTWGAIELAKGMEGPIGFIDSENGKGRDLIDYLGIEVYYYQLKKHSLNDEDYKAYEELLMRMSQPFHPDNYVKLLQQAIDDGCKTIIIDSLSHSWQWRQDQVAAAPSKDDAYGKKYQVPNAENKKLINAILQAPVNIIFTCRGKENKIVTDDAEKTQKRSDVNPTVVCVDDKVYTLEQADDIGYEATVVFFMESGTHNAHLRKAPPTLFTNRLNAPLTKEDGEEAEKWCNKTGALQEKIDDFLKTSKQEFAPSLDAIKEEITELAKKKMEIGISKETIAEAVKRISGDSKIRNIATIPIAFEVLKAVECLTIEG